MQYSTVDPDEEIVGRAKSGDAAAFEELYRNHVASVYALCVRLVGDAAAAETLTQDVFVRAWEKLSTFSGRGTFSAWLRRLGLNVVFSDAATRRRSVTEELTTDPPVESLYVGVALDLESAITRLPRGARIVFVLYDVEGYRHREIADMTGVTVGAVKSQLHRARRLLREILSDRDSGGIDEVR